MYKASLVLLVTLSGLSGCGKELPPVPEPESRPAKLFTVSVGNNAFERNFPATTEAGDKAVLAFRVPGLLQTLDVTAGQQVSKGEKLAMLNPDEYQLLEKQARANFKLADVQYQRAIKLRKDRVVSEQDFDQAKANHNSARAVLNQAKANLRYTTLIAPYEGTISIIPAENHEYIAAKQGVMNIQTNQILKVVFLLPDQLITRFSSGFETDATMVFDAFPEHFYELTFQEVDTEADPKTGSYKVTMIMERPTDIGILPGMSGTVKLVSAIAAATKIPTSAMMTDGDDVSVWRVNNDGIVEQVAIVIDEKRHIVSGLNDGDRVVTSGVNGLESGVKVREWIKERGL